MLRIDEKITNERVGKSIARERGLFQTDDIVQETRNSPRRTHGSRTLLKGRRCGWSGKGLNL